VATALQLRDTVDFESLLSENSRKRIHQGSKREVVPAGRVFHHAGGPKRVYIVERGLIRIFWADPDGRQATVAFIGSHHLLGGAITVTGEQWQGGSAQAVVDTTLLNLNLTAVRRAADEELDVSHALSLDLAALVRMAFRTIVVRSLGNVSQRLAYDLLERACQKQLETGRLEAAITHAELADSIGSSREVVSRALKDYRATGIIQTSPRCVRVVKPLMLFQTIKSYVV
jgi:CRP/FNR family transcriptional regulator, cyclic AMP receptor protein